jgi:hypothetical protein
VGGKDDGVEAGAAFYTRRSLAVYDPMILGFFCRVAWKCPAPRIVEHYDANVTANHLDVGVGTGYFLDHCRFPADRPRLGLMDLNPTCLEVAAQQVERYLPETYEANVLEPVTIDAARFTSVGMTFLLHCLPGTIAEKAVAFDHVRPLLEPGAVVFGATLLQGGVERSWYARQVMARNNRHGIFHNEHDDLDGLRRELTSRFTDVTVETIGCVGVFSARVSGGR